MPPHVIKHESIIRPARGVAAQAEFESKIEAKSKAVDHNSHSSAEFQAVSTSVS
jgi:hypothetical protein